MEQTSGVEPLLLVGIVQTATKELEFDIVKDKQEEVIVNFLASVTKKSVQPNLGLGGPHVAC